MTEHAALGSLDQGVLDAYEDDGVPLPTAVAILSQVRARGCVFCCARVLESP